MKRIAVLALLTVIALGSAVPQAHALGVMASWWNIDETNDDGFGAGLRSKTQVIPMVAIDTRISWINFSDAETNVFPIEATALLKLAMFYGGIGFGYYIFDSDAADLDNNFGWYLVGGIELSISKFGVFGEVKYTQLSTDIGGVDPGLGNLPTELEADGIGFNLGVMMGIPGM